MGSEEFFTEADWRCQIVVRVAAPTTVPNLGLLPKGVVGKGVGIADYQAGQLAFCIPNATALFLNLAKSHYESAIKSVEAFSTVTSCEKHTDGTRTGYVSGIKGANDKATFAYIENIMASVVFSYTALESFANEEIPDDHIYEISKNKCKEVYDKEQIEKNVNLQTKLGDILPIVCKVPSPKGGAVWQSFIELEKLRHGIIHMKKLDREHIGYLSQSIWSKLIKDPAPDTATVAKNVIDHFYVHREMKPHWYENIPF